MSSSSVLVLLYGMFGGAFATGCERASTPESRELEPTSRDAEVASPTKAAPVEPVGADTAVQRGGADASATSSAERGAADTGAVADTNTSGNDAEVEAPGGAADDEPAPTPEALLGRVRSLKTKDDAAFAALADAEKLGAKRRQLAGSANARGEALYGTPERAAKFLRWAADKDTKYPDPVFNLAKQAVIEGDVDAAKKHLVEVGRRGGKKLLAQIEFDPMWEIVKDDPEVQALLR